MSILVEPITLAGRPSRCPPRIQRSVWRRCNLDVVIPIPTPQTSTCYLSSHQLPPLSGKGYLAPGHLPLDPQFVTSRQLNRPRCLNHLPCSHKFRYPPMEANTHPNNTPLTLSFLIGQYSIIAPFLCFLVFSFTSCLPHYNTTHIPVP